MKRTLIVDGLNLFTRHYAAHPAMSDNGEQIGGIVGFFYAVINMVEKFKPHNTIVVWEGGGSKRKRDFYKDYKQQSRPQRLNRYYDDIPDTLQNRNFQIKTLIALLDNMPISQIYVEDCEADDVIGYLSKYKFKETIQLILSSDHDYYQLLNKKNRIWSPTVKALVDTQAVIDRFGIHPVNFCLAKSIVGDPADNIIGVKGVGYKILAKHFKKFQDKAEYTIEGFLEDVGMKYHERNLKTFRSILDSTDVIRRNWRLVLLDMQNLAHEQVKRIDYCVDKRDVKADKIKALQLLLKNGICNLNIDKGFLIFKINNYNLRAS